MIHFDKATHTYTVKGQKLPCVSDIIAPAVDLDGIPEAILAKARERGEFVHLACELHDRGQLDEAALDPALRPYLRAWQAFTREYQPEWTAIEEPDYHKTLLYAGTPDRKGRVLKQYRATVDIKAVAEIRASTGLQLNGYDLMDPSDRLICVQLRPDATYRVREFEKDHAGFLSFYGVFNWLRRNK